MKRSAQIGLVVMGALGVTVASGYWLNAQCDRQARSNPQSSPDSSCRHSSWWHSSYGGHSSSTTTPAAKPSSTPGTSTAQRGGFGSTGKGFGGGS